MFRTERLLGRLTPYVVNPILLSGENYHDGSGVSLRRAGKNRSLRTRFCVWAWSACRMRDVQFDLFLQENVTAGHGVSTVGTDPQDARTVSQGADVNKRGTPTFMFIVPGQ